MEPTHRCPQVRSFVILFIGGDFYIFKYEPKQCLWRKDNHSYVLRKGSQAVREDQMRLKHEGLEFAISAYTVGSGDKTPESFKRRAYWLKENPQYVIVHYLDEANKYYT